VCASVSRPFRVQIAPVRKGSSLADCPHVRGLCGWSITSCSACG
jgi:hypothetical protein